MKNIFIGIMYGKNNPQMKIKYMWFSMGTMMFALSSLLMTIVISRTMGESIGGMFSVGLSLAQWLATIAYFEIRTYQVTDVKNEYSFSEYLQLRLVMCLLAFAACIGYSVVNGYTPLKMQVVLLICAYKLIEAFADVCEGEFQKEDRIDAAGKSEFFRVFISMITMTAVAYTTGNIIITLVAMNISAILCVLLLDICVVGSRVAIRLGFVFAKMKGLVFSCFPLTVSSFLHNYIINSSKFAVDKVLGDVAQLYYTAIFMPNMVINLFSGIIFKPMQTSMAQYYNDREWKKFSAIIYKMIGIITAFTLICMVCAYFLGIPVLSFIYKTNLKGNKTALLMLLLCGGVNAVNIILYYVLAIIRKQKSMTIMYLIAGLAAVFVMTPVVRRFELLGAALGYLCVVTLLLLLLSGYIFLCIRKIKASAK